MQKVELTIKEKTDMIDLWISELKGIRLVCISKGEVDPISQLKIKRINKEIKEMLGDIHVTN